VTVDRPGDFSTYTLRLVKSGPHGRPGERPFDHAEGFDPRYTRLPFSFKVNCPSDLDCAPVADCPPPALTEPAISYLAKDYASFRQLILDRLALIMPGWQERHIPDGGIALIELLAYTGDYLSYYQDAVATEAYLDTARRRFSVRRHVRLIDYPMHDGCNARAWVCVETSARVTLPQDDFYFVTGYNDALPLRGWALLHADLNASGAAGTYEVFEPLVRGEVTLDPAHNAIAFWTWGDEECCLPRGATRATLADAWEPAPAGDQEAAPKAAGQQRALHLQPGDVLIFEEVKGPQTGALADADPTHRQAVRLTSVEPGVDGLYDQPVIEIAWAPEDALQFPLCLSTVGGKDCAAIDGISVARGNVILVDHGRSRPRCDEAPETFTVPDAALVSAGCDGIGEPRDPVARPVAFTPALAFGPVTQVTSFPAPDELARRQARRLERVLERVRERLEQLWRHTRGGRLLSEDELSEIQVIFGARAMTTVGLPTPGRQPPHPPHHGEEARALAWLLAREERYLGKKLRRIHLLAARARGGCVLGPAESDEIAESFGQRYATGLAATNPAFFGPASSALAQDPRAALPAICLRPRPAAGQPAPPCVDDPARWTVRRDLLGSHSRDRHFVAEIDDEGRAQLRFGDGELGQAVTSGAVFQTTYRTGNGTAGNVGREVIARIVTCQTRLDGIARVRNPLPAAGGVDPEPLAEVKLFAPATFRRQLQRAITAADYAALAGQFPGVQRAAADLRWSGSWYEVQVALDPRGSEEADPHLLASARAALYRYRRAGHDLVVQGARYVPLDIALRVCVRPEYLRGHVEAALLDRFSNRLLPDGTRGFFHPDNLTFGDGLYLSKLVARAQAVAGVESVEVTRLQRLFGGDYGELAQCVLALGPLEIARLDNDRGQPEHGKLTLTLGGGR
ncbi:MAG: putative baseplate assembly protein, partial [Thermomicrobiales bacterium]